MSYGYVPPPPPAPGSAGDLSPAQSRQGKSLTRVIILVITVVVLFAGLFVGGVITIIFRAMKSSEPYQHAVQAATLDPRVVAELGAPVEPGWLFSGSIQVSGSSGSADLSIPLHGSRAKGTLYVVARKSAGRWTYQTLEVDAEGQPDLDLRQPPGATPEAR